MTCDGYDVIGENILVPINLNVGDWLCFSGMGAYTYGSKSFFNGMNTTTYMMELTPLEKG